MTDIDEKLMMDTLCLLQNEFKKKYGTRQSKLKEQRFQMVDRYLWKQVSNLVYYHNNVEKSHIREVAKELEYRNYIQFSANRLEFYLTEQGYSFSASQNNKTTWFNKALVSHKRMSFVVKVGFWGSIASIVGLAITFLPLTASSIEQQVVNGSKSTVIGENNGTINIGYGDSNQSAKKGHVLRNQQYGVALVVSKPDLNVITDKSYHICNAIAGTQIELTGRSLDMSGLSYWKEVAILSGECSGRVGWTTVSNISYE